MEWLWSIRLCLLPATATCSVRHEIAMATIGGGLAPSELLLVALLFAAATLALAAYVGRNLSQLPAHLIQLAPEFFYFCGAFYLVSRHLFCNFLGNELCRLWWKFMMFLCRIGLARVVCVINKQIANRVAVSMSIANLAPPPEAVAGSDSETTTGGIGNEKRNLINHNHKRH